MALGKRDVRPDPILTNIAMEYGTGGGFAYEQCVPARRVESREFEFAIWDLGKYTTDDTEALRAPGAGANEDTDPGLTWTTGVVKTYALKTRIPDELRAEAPNPAALERAKVQRMVMSLRRRKEIAFAATCRDTATYAHTTPGVKWDAAANVVIEANIDAAKEAFLLLCGYEPTHIVVPPAVAKVFKRDSTIRGLRKFTDESLLINGELPPVVFGLNVVVPGAVRSSSAAGVAPALARVWSTDDVTLLYVNPAAAADPEAMTAVMEFGLTDPNFPSGASYPVTTWRDPDQSAKTDWYSVENSYMQQAVAACIYILHDVLT